MADLHGRVEELLAEAAAVRGEAAACVEVEGFPRRHAELRGRPGGRTRLQMDGGATVLR